MGKGDIKSKKGKIRNGSFGKKRPSRVKAAVVAPSAKPKKKTKKASA